MSAYLKINPKGQITFHAEGDPAPPAPAPAPAPAPVPEPNPAPAGGQKFTADQQAEINRLVMEERRKAEERNTKTITELENLRKNQNLTQQERDRLGQQIEELRSQYQTKEQQQLNEYQKLQKKHQDDVKGLTTERDSWKERYDNKTMTVDIYNASVEFKAISPEQIEAILRPMTRVTEELDEGGKPTGRHVSRVNFIGKDKDGKPVKLELSVRDAVKAMREWTEKYGNLFENDARGGIGANPSGGGTSNGDIPDIDSMTPQQYSAHRDKIRVQLGRK